ncbi:ABC transporter ATP-binding protein [Paenibacillus tianjinensis]|uniref:ATP-binding cassette domain-containing protein n=1 Tax=Paenibacillus tianjinensis TaxID=2810347 RepID=A0ABX7LIN3_9BACL|nr:ATP-binding cassette domain-containing protein [Paenibacillus tianjinensis]QSF45767.1 ATP-binding cassette domain-containing protein [Paenibacillus tianjinensis]
MEIITAERLSFRYPEEDRDSLHELSFSVEEGEFVVLLGPSGCGKTTLLRHLKRELTPVGTGSGMIRYQGQPLAELPAEKAAGDIGMVFQNPDAQIVMDTVWHELAFAMENLGYPPSVMRSRLAEMAGLFGLEPLLYKSVHELSGGQKQLLNLASVLLLQPKLLLLDEPTSQLDPVAAREFIQTLYRLNEEMSMTIIISEHRLEEVLPLADRVLLLEDGVLQASGSPREFVRGAGDARQAARRAYLPTASRLFLALSPEGELPLETIPLTVREGKRWLQAYAATGQEMLAASAPEPAAAIRAERSSVPAATLLGAREVTFRYEKDGPEVLRKLNLSLHQGELLAILGGNGAGKSTLLQVLSGLAKPQRGNVDLAKGVTTGYLAQNPLLYFSFDTVIEELRHMASVAGLANETAQSEIERLLEVFQLQQVLESHPHDLSGGQQQKLALAMIMLLKPAVLLLDEPTKGLDPEAKSRFAGLLGQLLDQGISIGIVTHDVEFAARYASRCALLFDGSITAEGRPSAFFSSNYFYTTAVNRMVRDILPQALTIEDVMAAWHVFASRL